MYQFSQRSLFLMTFIFVFTFASCGDDEQKKTTVTKDPTPLKEYKIPAFSADSAYVYIEKQVAFGPRVPNTEAHRQASAWYIKKFKGFGASIVEQDYEVTAHWGEKLKSKNIMAQYNPKAKKRILFAAHWDSRKVADKDIERVDEAIDGADDGGSGVGVLLEIARQLQLNPIAGEDLGIDLLLFDSEDQGKDSDDGVDNSLTWCLGSQYWGKNIVPAGYKANYGILLDMVGSKDAKFGKDEFSMQVNPELVNKVWKLAGQMNAGRYFTGSSCSTIDDHIFVSNYARIPMIDIINMPNKNGQYCSFGTYHHTHDDNMNIISKKTLGKVGQVMLAVIYREASGTFR